MRSLPDKIGYIPAGVVAALAIAAGVALSGCDFEHERYLRRADTVTLGAGEAAAFNSAVQTIDPWPRYSQNANIPISGKKALLATQRYQHDDVKMPTPDPYPGDWDGEPPKAPATSNPYASAAGNATGSTTGSQPQQ